MSAAPKGQIGFDILRNYIESNSRRRVLLLGAFRGKAVKTQHRFSRGAGTFSGPYYGIDQASDKLSLDLFRTALLELHINLPLEESEAIFTAMADENGLVGIVDLIREIKAEPCDRSGRGSRSRYGQQFKPSHEPLSKAHHDRVAPTLRSGYTGERGWVRPAHRPAPEAPSHRAPPPPPPEAMPHPSLVRDKRGQFHNGANVLSSNVSLGSDASVKAASRSSVEPPKHRKAPAPPPPNIAYPRNVPSAFIHEQTYTDVSDPMDEDRFVTSAAALHRRAPPPLPVQPDVRSLSRPSTSGFTHGASIFVGGEKEKPPPTAPPPPPPGPVLPRKPWTSGYNRSENIKVGRPDMKEAWAEGENPYQRYGIPNEPAPTPKPQPDAIVMPTVRTSTQLMDTDASAFFLRSQALSVPHTPLPKPPRRFCY